MLRKPLTKMSLGVLALAMALLISSCMIFQPEPEYVTDITGRAILEGETSHAGITIYVRYYDSASGDYVLLASETTGTDGRFSMRDVPFVPQQVSFTVYASKSGYASADESFAIYYGYDGSPFVFDNMVLHRQKKLVMEWASKEGPGTSFVGARTGQATLYSYVLGVTESTPYYYNFDGVGNSEMSFYDDDDAPMSVLTGSRTVWDVGAVGLETVTDVPTSSGRTYTYVRLYEGHTYVVRTDRGYAKFRVISLSDA
jgi:hypothetical protein